MEHVIIKHSPRARRVALRLDPQKRVINLVVPKGMSLKKAEAFALGHKNWIENVIRDLPPAVPYQDGKILPVLGKERIINICYDTALKRTDIILKENELIVCTNKEDPSARIERFLKITARKQLSDLAHEKADRIGKTIHALSIRDTKSRWGSCSEDGRISFSWRLVFAPYAAMDYVVAHEVAHLVHLHHKTSFWNLCADLSEDYLEGRYWMRNHAHELMRYGATS